MAQAFLHGSGFDPLNFRVVGGAAAPANHRENTIWVTNPNLLDFKAWAANIGVANGTKTYTDNSITLTATANDCYTHYSSNYDCVKIPVVSGKTYVLSWEHTGSYGYVYLFPAGGGTGAKNSISSNKKLEITIAEGISFVTFRVGVSASGGAATYSDITFREKPADITGWHLGAEEPNVWDVPIGGDAYSLQVPIKLSEGDILNFTIPATVGSIFEAIRIQDAAGKLYFVRSSGGAAITGWNATVKVGLVISNKSYPIGSWGSQGGTAHLHKWNSYYHKEGILWIVTGAASSAAFNALKRNDLRVYPVSAKQYVNGAWKDQEARICQRSRWVDWVRYLYNTGDECTDLTGGWVSKEWTYSSGVNTIAGTQTIQRNSDSIQFVKEGLKGGAFHTANKIDLSGVKTIKFEGSMPAEPSGDEWHMIFGVWADLNGSYAYDSAVAKLATTTSGRTSFSLDVSSLNGTYYVGFAKYDAGTITMKKLYLER